MFLSRGYYKHSNKIIIPCFWVGDQCSFSIYSVLCIRSTVPARTVLISCLKTIFDHLWSTKNDHYLKSAADSFPMTQHYFGVRLHLPQHLELRVRSRRASIWKSFSRHFRPICWTQTAQMYHLTFADFWCPIFVSTFEEFLFCKWEGGRWKDLEANWWSRWRRK